MIALLQRVTEAGVDVNSQSIARIDTGLLVLVGVEPDDGAAQVQRLATRVANYRLFNDDQGRMNCSITQVNGQLLLVPQFTLAADTNSGNRPGFSTAAPPEQGRELFESFVTAVNQLVPGVQAGIFGANMQVSLVNDGPVTFWLQVK